MPEAKPSGKSFYVTTPIFYVNDAPHIGHAYTEVASDVLTRWQRQMGNPAFLLTGTDEHGEKILRTASANGSSPKEWADKLVHDAWLPLLETLDIDNQDFIRTTEERHKINVQRFLQQLKDKGFIYQGSYEGNYCVGCEEFKTESDLIEGEGAFADELVCAIHSKPVERLEETNYFFKLSEFQKPLLDYYEQNPKFIQPESARNEVVSFVRRELTDLSISRSKDKFDWGIDIPWDKDHVIYVWFDALLNYITAVGYGADEAKLNSLWPASVQVVGKDILRFHAVIWPAMLMAAGLKPAERVFAHGWLLVGGEKMSKSKLTGIAPSQITDVFGSDAFRYYFLRAIAFGQDGSFSWEDLAARYQAELANGFGNLASRVIAMVHKYFDGRVPNPSLLSERDAQVSETAKKSIESAAKSMDEIAIQDALVAIWDLVDELNSYLTEEQPWILAKEESNRERLGTVLYTALEGLRVLTIALAPFIPKATAKLWAAIGSELGELADQRTLDSVAWNQIKVGSGLGELEALFPRQEEKA
ncbi:MAG: methionine--tRNA ligase [Actinomycetota bacterium]